MEIPLNTKLHITYLKHEDKAKAVLLAKLVEKKLNETKWIRKINELLCNIGRECIDEM